MYDKFSYIYDELMKRQVDYDLLASNVIQICDKYEIAVKNILECGMGSFEASNHTCCYRRKLCRTTYFCDAFLGNR